MPQYFMSYRDIHIYIGIVQSNQTFLLDVFTGVRHDANAENTFYVPFA